MKYELILSQEQIAEIRKTLKIVYLDEKQTPSGGYWVEITINDSTDILSLFYAGCYYALNKKINA